MRLTRPLTLMACAALLGLMATSAGADATLLCPGAPNSAGPGAVLRWEGAFDPFGGDLRVEGLPAGEPGFVLYALGHEFTPWGNGNLCLGGSKWILAHASSDAAGVAQIDLLQDGDEEDLRWLNYKFDHTWFFQYAYRDRAAGGAGFNLSSALTVTFE